MKIYRTNVVALLFEAQSLIVVEMAVTYAFRGEVGVEKNGKRFV